MKMFLALLVAAVAWAQTPAFDVKGFQIVGGPGWLDAARYDIVATTGKSGDISDAELRPMLQALLADRFALKFHREAREMTAYSLTVVKNGPKLTAHQGAGYSSSSSGAGSGCRFDGAIDLYRARRTTRAQAGFGKGASGNYRDRVG
jgi:uncharacterized protein (TIGR03435 family)